MSESIVSSLLVKFGIVPDEKGAKEAESQLDKLIEKTKELVTEFVAFEGIKRFGEMIFQVAENAERLALASQELGIGTDELQKYEYAAKLAGMSNDELNLSFRFLLRNMGQAAEGSKEAQKAFAQLGISVKDANGKVKTVDEALPEIADKFRKVEDPAKRVRIAMELFGRAGARMIPFLLAGKEGLAQIGDEAQKLGGILSEDQIQIGESFVKNLRAVGQFFTGIKNAVALPLIKHLDQIVMKMRGWMVINGELIRSRISAFFDALGKGLEKVAQLAEPFVSGLLVLFKLLTEVNPELLALAVVLGAIALAFGVAALGPVLFAAALAILIEDIYGYFTGKKSVTGYVVDAMSKIFDELTTPRQGEPWFVTMAKEGAIYLKNIFTTLFTDLSIVLGAFLTGNFKDIPATVKNLASDFANNLGSFGDIQKGYEAAKNTPIPSVDGSDYAPGASNSSSTSNASQSVIVNAPITVHGSSDPEQAATVIGSHLQATMAAIPRVAF